MSAPEYRIEGLADFLKVPVERQAACLADFHLWLAFARDSQPTNDVICADLGLPGKLTLNPNVFTWRDDGVEGLGAVNITAGKETFRVEFE